MKKTLAILLALILALVNVSLALAGSEGVEEEEPAAGESSYQDLLDVTLKLPKNYIVNNGTAPAETFTFKFEGVSYVNGAGEKTTEGIPAIADKEIAYTTAITEDTEKTVEIPITASQFQLGVYTYKVTEVIPEDGSKTAGIDYEDTEFYMVLTILSEGTAERHFVCVLHEGSVDGVKTSELENTYDAGTLEVTKTTTGNLADLSKKFAFTISFEAGEGEQVTDAQKNAIVVTVPKTEGTDGAWAEDKLEYTVNLANGESIKFENLPQRVTYTVAEDPEEYTADKEKATGTITGGEDSTEEFTNELTIEVDTGVTVETVPYIMILAVVMIGAALLVLRKREEY